MLAAFRWRRLVPTPRGRRAPITSELATKLDNSEGAGPTVPRRNSQHNVPLRQLEAAYKPSLNAAG